MIDKGECITAVGFGGKSAIVFLFSWRYTSAASQQLNSYSSFKQLDASTYTRTSRYHLGKAPTLTTTALVIWC
jgi:hypothetical protein